MLLEIEGKEVYVSLFQAKLLKEMGFDERCMGYYPRGEVNKVHHSLLFERNSEWLDGSISAPTLPIAKKWIEDNSVNIVII